MEHTKENWVVSDHIYGSDGKRVASHHVLSRDDSENEANARRIVACVNACAGISTENLEDNLPVKELARRYNNALKQRDKLLEELEAAAKYHASHECYAEAKRVESFLAGIKGESA